MASPGRYIGTTNKGLTQDFIVPVPWGEVAGKTWGNKNDPPILCLHGWLDNSNTFDKLIPLLSQDNYYIVFDMPGHGLSSNIPNGMYYSTMAYCAVTKRVIDHFKVKNITILGHSMGGNIGAYFGGVFPEITKRLIIIDAVGVWFRTEDDLVSSVRSCIDSHMQTDYAAGKMEKNYTYDEAKERLKSASKGLTNEAVEVLLERGLKHNEDGNFKFRRDVRLILKNPTERSFETALEFVVKNNADVLSITAKSGLAKMILEKHGKEAQILHQTYKAHCKSFQLLELEGHHHLHLCTPEKVAKEISEFLLSHSVDEDMGSGKL